MQDLNEKFISMMCCPWTQEKLEIVNEDELKTINEKIGQGKLSNKIGQQVNTPITQALKNSSSSLIYAIRDGLPNMLTDDAIVNG